MNHLTHFSVCLATGRWDSSGRRGREGSALLIVLVMVVLLTVLMLAYLLNSAADRRLSNSSLNQTIADQLAYSAANVVIGDLKQEIVNSTYSTITTVGPSGATSTISMPKLSATSNYSGMLPMTNSATATIPNLVRISLRSDPIALPGVPSRASAASSSAASLNNRSVTAKRWNAHFLIPLNTPGGTTISGTVPDSTPSAAAKFTVPDWVFVNGNGPQVITAPSSSVIGRYAYAIYDEGGLHDVNVAGTPTNSASTPVSTGTLTSAQSSNKSSLALIDLTNLLDNSGNQLITAAAENALVGWRNYASLQSNFQTAATDSISSGQFPAGFVFSANNATDYYFNFGRGSSFAYLKANYMSTGTNKLTDQNFLTRQQLIAMQYALQQTVGFSPSALQYLTTYSRSLDQPSYAPNASRPITASYTAGTDPATVSATNPNGVPATVYANTAAGNDNLINPSFLTVRAGSTVSAGRNDGTDITIGEPLVKKRFALNRLAWLTYEGPLSDGSNVGTATTAAQVNASNADLQTIAGYLHDNYGLSYAFLSKGTAANIYKYFGLSWVTDTRTYGNSLYGATPSISQKKWLYNHSNSNATGPFTSLPAASSSGPILRVGRPVSVTTPDPTRYVQDLATPREADFFELLKAAIVAGSKGKTATLQLPFTGIGQTFTSGHNADDFQNRVDSSLEYQIIQIGANIIEQSRLDGYTVQILYNDGSITATKEFSGTENLPYIYGMRTGIVQGKKPIITNPPQPSAYPPYNAYSTTPSSAPSISDTGYSVAMEFPIVWNPQDQNSPRCATDSSGNLLTDSSGKALFPTSFRIVADSTDPDDISIAGTSYDTIQLKFYNQYQTTSFQNVPTSTPTYSGIEKSYITSTNTPISAPFVQTSQLNNNSPSSIFYLKAESTALTFTIDDKNNPPAATYPAPSFFREPTFLISPNVPVGSSLKASGSANCLNPANAPGTNNYPSTNVFPTLQSSPYMDMTSGALNTTDILNADTSGLNLSPILGFT